MKLSPILSWNLISGLTLSNLSFLRDSSSIWLSNLRAIGRFFILFFHIVSEGKARRYAIWVNLFYG